MCAALMCCVCCVALIRFAVTGRSRLVGLTKAIYRVGLVCAILCIMSLLCFAVTGRTGLAGLTEDLCGLAVLYATLMRVHVCGGALLWCAVL